MKNFSTWLLVMFMAMFLVLRIMVAYNGEFGESFAGLTPFNQTFEVVNLFVAIIAIVLVVKRSMLGAIVYFLGYGIYFGIDFMQIMTSIVQNGFSVSYGLPGIVSMIGFILPCSVFLDMAADKARIKNPTNKKTDWYYKNGKYDRDDLDERRDKNNYRLS